MWLRFVAFVYRDFSTADRKYLSENISLLFSGVEMKPTHSIPLNMYIQFVFLLNIFKLKTIERFKHLFWTLLLSQSTVLYGMCITIKLQQPLYYSHEAQFIQPYWRWNSSRRAYFPCKTSTHRFTEYVSSFTDTINWITRNTKLAILWKPLLPFHILRCPYTCKYYSISMII